MRHFQETELEFVLDRVDAGEYPSIRGVVVRVYGERDVEDAVAAVRERFSLSPDEWKLNTYERARM